MKYYLLRGGIIVYNPRFYGMKIRQNGTANGGKRHAAEKTRHFKERLIGLIIESPVYAKTQRAIFNLAWLGATSFVVR